LALDKHSSLLGGFISNEEIVLRVRVTDMPGKEAREFTMLDFSEVKVRPEPTLMKYFMMMPYSKQMPYSNHRTTSNKT